jgi:hypothetical protein
VPALAALLILAACGVFLKRYWWDACRADFERVEGEAQA